MGITYDKSTERQYRLIDWDNLMSMSEVCETYEKEKSTVARNVKKGIFVEGVDCKKIGTSWAFDKRRMDEIYRK